MRMSVYLRSVPYGTLLRLRHLKRVVCIFFYSPFIALVFNAVAEEVHVFNSPDSSIQVSIRMPVPGSQERPRWSASFRGNRILTDCGLGLQTADQGDLMVGARVLDKRSRSVDERIPVLFGKSDHASGRFRETRYTLETPQHRRVDVVFRCYDDAVALRYELPALENATSITITNETTSFRLEGEPTAYVQYLENYTTSHEHQVVTTRYQDIQRGVLLDMPLTLFWEDSTFAALTEASLRHYAGMSLMRPLGSTAREELVCQLTPRPDGTKVMRPSPLQTPWRVVLIGNRPGALLESETIYCLKDLPVIKDASWIKPRKITVPVVERDTLKLHLALDGGFVARLVPAGSDN
jgi:alpha-glucosidase